MIIDALAGLISGALGAMGFGGGGVLILYLTLYKNIPQQTAQGINLIFFIPSAIIAVLKHKKNHLIDSELSKKYLLNGLLGVVVGFILINKLNEDLLAKVFGSVLIIFGIKELISNKKN